MKKNIFGIAIVASFLSLLWLASACTLPEAPNDFIKLKDSYKTFADATKWDNGLYSTLRGKMGGPFVLPQEIQADMLNAHAAVGTYYTDFHSWDIRSNSNVLKAIYQAYNAALADVNLVIEMAPALEVEPDDEKTAMRHYQGNAYFLRAYYHFNLAIRWGQRYNAATAATDLCVPIVKEFKPLLKPGRATNEQVYSFILADLDKAEELLADVPTKEGSDKITAHLVKALRARVLLYTNDMAGALKNAEELIASNTYPLLPNEPAPDNIEKDAFVQMWHQDSGKEQIFQPFIQKPNEQAASIPLYGADYDMYKHQLNKKEGGRPDLQYNRPRYLPSEWVGVGYLFDIEHDRRTRAYFEWGYTRVGGLDESNLPAVLVVAKFKGNRKYSDIEVNDEKLWGGYLPNGITAPKPFRIAEQYLIAAEAAYETQNEEKAKQYLNALRTSRGLEEVTTLTGSELQQEIRNERARELLFEGFRLWDLRRWGLSVERKQPQSQSNSIDKHPFLSKYFDLNMRRESNDDKFVWGFPIVELKVNRQIVQNKGW